MDDQPVSIDADWYGYPAGHEALSDMLTGAVGFAERLDGLLRVVCFAGGDLYCTDDQGEIDGPIPGHIARWLLAQAAATR